MSTPVAGDAGAYMARHSRSFRLATLALPARERGRIERLYAWCRHVDDLVDRAPHPALAEGALDRWLCQSRLAYDGFVTGEPLLDQVMGELRASGAPFAFAERLVAGVRSDLDFRPFETMEALRGYTFDVASVVGLWLCALHGVRERWMTDRAAALGHAMQLTNILRDVGDDLAVGRIYLPLEVMEAHRVRAGDLALMRAGARPVSDAYRGLLEDLMARADADYRLAAQAIPRLPQPFGRSVAIAAAVYRDIHSAIRANGYDNLRRRAYTTLSRKVLLAAGALWRSTPGRVPAPRASRRAVIGSACT